MTPPSTDDTAPAGPQTLAAHLHSRVERLCAEHCQLIQQQVDAYRPGGLVREDDLLEEGRAHVTFMLAAMGQGSPDVTPATRLGRKRAREGIPLADVMSAYRVGLRFWWETIARTVNEVGLPRHTLITAGSEVWQHQADYSNAMTAAYREVVTEQLLQRSHARAALVAGLLVGTLPAEISKLEAMRILGLPDSGHFVVIAISVDALTTCSSNIETLLEALGFPSAWRLEHDAQIGLVSLVSGNRLARLDQVLTTNVDHRIGVSPLYEGLPPPGEGLRYARAALLATTKTERSIVFDQNPYAVAAVAEPEIMGRYAKTVLAGLSVLNIPDRTALLGTLREWIASGGTVTDAADALSCHPNTVRYRLRRLKEYTGLDVARPDDVAELRLAIEVETRLRSD